jgi:hypothetical protein
MENMPDDFSCYSIPILLCVFNRPDLTKLAIDNLRTVKPNALYVSADGPRLGNISDATNCQQVRELVELIDWPCQVKTRYLESNVGCGQAVSEAIRWFFENEEEGIILEDDTLPVPYFFTFAQEMLEKFRNNDRVFMISGTNLYPQRTKDMNYLFTRSPSAWGWATWRRAWKLYDFHLAAWKDPSSRNTVRGQIDGFVSRSYLSSCFDDVVNSKVDTWDYQWIFAGIVNSAVGVTSGQNLVTNTGIQGTHSTTKSKSHLLVTSDQFRMDLTRHSPTRIKASKKYDYSLTAGRLLPIVARRKLRTKIIQVKGVIKRILPKKLLVHSSRKQ